VIGPLFHEHRILTQVAGHRLNVLKILPPLTIAEDELRRFADALEGVIAKARRIPRAMVRTALRTSANIVRR
jgi:acetylornithine/succinyldiaminopimelate/putrescine aminotransferase